VRNIRLLIWCIGATLAAQVKLPRETVEVKLAGDRLVSLESTGRLVERTLAGRTVRIVEAGAGVEDLRRTEVKDFTLDEQGTLIVSLGIEHSLGRSSRRMGFYPRQGQPRVIELDDVVCLRVAAEPANGAWCLGPGFGDELLHRVSGAADGHWSLLPKKAVRLLGNPGGQELTYFDSGATGVPVLYSPAAGKLVAFLPNAESIYEIDTRTGRIERRELPFRPHGRSFVTVAGDHALLPLLAEGEEQLTTPYGLFRWNKGWERVGTRTWPRGTALLGVNENAVRVWNRTAQQVESSAWQPK
jgi:hypothetical protein